MTEEDESRAVPPVCAVCASSEDLEQLSVKKVFTPSWVWLLLPLGVLPAAVVGMMVQTKHNLLFRFCGRCRRRRAWAETVHWLAALCCIGMLFAAVAAGISLRSWLAFWGVIAIVVLIAAASTKFDASVNPRYSVFTATRVEIEIPGHGRFLVFPPYYLLPPRGRV